MRTHIRDLWGIVLVLLLAGCGGGNNANDQPLPSKLGDTIDLSLADLLTKPRAELAEMGDEWTTKAQFQHKAHGEGKFLFGFLPDVHLPLVIPGFREVKYSAKAGLSLPPYLNEDDHDSAVALHLAHYGDIEAARKLVAPGDEATKARIESFACERNYPVEWTRLVALLQHEGQIRLAAGDVDGGTQVNALHKQLRELLDAKAAQGPLGAALLGRGKDVLAKAANAWRADRKPELSGQANTVVANWGPTPIPQTDVTLGVSRDEVQRVLGSPGKGAIVPAQSALRALDLLELPFPNEAVEAAIAAFDDRQRLSDIYVTYRPGVSDTYPEPAHLAHWLEEAGTPSQDATSMIGLRRRTYKLGERSCEVTVVVHGAGVGALIHLDSGKETTRTLNLARDFGGINLNRSFEQNRRHTAPAQRGETLTLKDAKVLAGLTNLLPTLKPTQALVRREGTADLTASLLVNYGGDVGGPPPMHEIVLPLWEKIGPGRLVGVNDDMGGHLALLWDDEQTRYVVRLPYESTQPVQFEVRDAQGPQHLAARVNVAAGLDREERRARITEDKPFLLIHRQLEHIALGMSRAEVLQVLPSGRLVAKQDLPNGLMVTFCGDPAPDDAQAIRQIFIRFDDTDHAVEVRGVYADGPAAGGKNGWMTSLLKSIKEKSGAPQEGPAPWSVLWRDLPPRRPAPALYRWQDDRTLLAYQRDSERVELTLRDCPLDYDAGIPLPPLEYLPRGVGTCVLGVPRGTLLGAAAASKPVTTPDGALILRPAEAGPYDALLVWFKGDQASRIIARHAPPTRTLGPAEWGQALTEAGTRELRTFSWPHRQDVTPHGILQSLSWNDDRTRVRMFWQESDAGTTHIFTEWVPARPE
jgi:hypothetical protein